MVRDENYLFFKMGQSFSDRGSIAVMRQRGSTDYGTNIHLGQNFVRSIAESVSKEPQLLPDEVCARKAKAAMIEYWETSLDDELKIIVQT